MPIFRSRSLTQRIVVTAGACLLAVAGALMLAGWQLSAQVRSIAVETSLQQARRAATERFAQAAIGAGDHLRARIAGAGAVIRPLARLLERTKAAQDPLELSRDQVVILLRTALENAPELARVWLCTAPGGLDALDQVYAGTPGHDASGRLVPSWTRTGTAAPVLAPLPGYGSAAQDAGGCRSDEPIRRTMAGAVERVVGIHAMTGGGDGGQRWVVTATVPVRVDGRTVAVIGADLPVEPILAALRTAAEHLDADGRCQLRCDSTIVLDPAVAVGQTVPAPTGGADGVIIEADGRWIRSGRIAVADDDAWTLVLSGSVGRLMAEATALHQQMTTLDRQSGLRIALVSCGMVLVALIALWLMARAIVRPVQRTAQALAGIASGDADLRHRLPVGGRDETAALAMNFNAFTTNLQQVVTAIAAQSSALATVADTLDAGASRSAAAADQARARIDEAAARAQQVRAGMTAALAAVDAMRTAVTAITAAAQRSAHLAHQAVDSADSAGGAVTRLGSSGREIGGVADLISDIAGQIDLLALNATIEAARAGESGRGFAVVAGEVKALARRTAEASQGIARTITAMQDDSAATASAIAAINGVIHDLDGLAQEIAAAVSAQAGSVAEMQTRLDEAGTGTTAIANGLTSVTAIANASAAEARDTTATANRLSTATTALQAQVGRFRI